MTLTVYHLKTCDTCRKAIKTLEAAGKTLTLIDVRADGISAQKLSELEKVVGFDKLLNTRSTTWRGLDEADKAALTSEKALALMGEHPTLIKRPVIDDGDAVTVGWTKDVQANYL